MTEDEFKTVLALAHELTHVECKGSGSLTYRSFVARVVRAILGMTNHRDGGIVVVGIEEAAGALAATGVKGTDLVTWNHDDLADKTTPVSGVSGGLSRRF